MSGERRFVLFDPEHGYFGGNEWVNPGDCRVLADKVRRMTLEEAKGWIETFHNVAEFKVGTGEDGAGMRRDYEIRSAAILDI